MTSERYMFMLEEPGGEWRVCVAAPSPGSKTERDMSDARLHRGEGAVEAAARDFLSRMRTQRLPGLIICDEARICGNTPTDICDTATFHIADDIPGTDDLESQVDDFDNHPLSELREALVDACPEYSGEDPDDTTRTPGP